MGILNRFKRPKTAESEVVHQDAVPALLTDQRDVPLENVDIDGKAAELSGEKHKDGYPVDKVSTQDVERDYRESDDYDQDGVPDVVVQGAEDIVEQIIDDQDDPSMPVLTFRFWFLGFGLSAFGSVLAEIYYWKPQGATVSVLFQLIIAYVLGNLMAKLPSRGWFRYINPGPFNIKEHACITIMASTASTTAEAIACIAVLDLYYSRKVNAGIGILQTWAAQIVGYGFSGVLQSSTVFPTYALWPSTIPTISLLQSMHFGGLMNKKKMRYFWIVFIAIFCWEIIPTWMFPLITAVSIVCLADKGQHDIVRNLFGAGSSNEGIGLFSFGFDWILISQAYPLYWPLQTQVNSWIGMAICYVLMMGAYYGNVGDALQNNLPFMSTSLFTNNGSSYDQSVILNTDGSLNKEAYDDYGRPYYTATYLMSTVTHNLSCGAAVTHVLLWHWKDIAYAVKRMRGSIGDDIEDPHYNKMKVYKGVPQWWYAVLLVVSLSVAMGTGYYGDVKNPSLPAWSVLIFTVIAFFFATILAFLNAVTGFNTSTKGIIQLIAAFIHKGKPISNMYAVLYGYSTQFQCLGLLSDQKLGQYAKIPPRCTFVAQLAGTVIGSLLNYVLYLSIVKEHREVLLDPIGTRIWAGWNAQSLNSNALTWGALAQELFTSGKPYWFVPAALGFGLLLPIPFWLMAKKFPNQRFWSYINMPIITNYMGWLPYSVNGMWWPGFVIGMASQWWARTRRPRWFIKYNYLTSAALDGGSSVIYFILQFAIFGATGTSVDFPVWWGNPDTSLLSADRCKVVG